MSPLVNAGLAQPVEQLIRNEQVVGSSPISSLLRVVALRTFSFAAAPLFIKK